MECFVVILYTYCAFKEPAPQLFPLYKAIAMVESSDGLNTKRLGHLGTYQISYDYWLDSEVPGSWDMVRSERYSRRVMKAYWGKHVPEALEAEDFQILSRVHYGGPEGHSNPETEFYWKLVRRKLE